MRAGRLFGVRWWDAEREGFPRWPDRPLRPRWPPQGPSLGGGSRQGTETDPGTDHWAAQREYRPSAAEFCFRLEAAARSPGLSDLLAAWPSRARCDVPQRDIPKRSRLARRLARLVEETRADLSSQYDSSAGR